MWNQGSKLLLGTWGFVGKVSQEWWKQLFTARQLCEVDGLIDILHNTVVVFSKWYMTEQKNHGTIECTDQRQRMWAVGTHLAILWVPSPGIDDSRVLLQPYVQTVLSSKKYNTQAAYSRFFWDVVALFRPSHEMDDECPTCRIQWG